MLKLHKIRDRRPTKRSAHAKTSSKLPNFGAMTFGFLLGVFATCLTVFMLSTNDITLKIPTHSKKPLQLAAAKPVAAPKPVQEPRFDFYTELAKNNNDAPVGLKSTPKTIHGYIVQAGSFRRSSDADALRAKLTLNGYVPKVDAIKQTDGEILHRVLLGTFKNEHNAKATQEKLKTLNINSTLVLNYAE
ncbi:MAG TPA: SPOR domain-containing protein [Gammaproteobacteria bacterium]|nr:SPOR domain-containing protein [Gammaproteobacteria bacterium]